MRLQVHFLGHQLNFLSHSLRIYFEETYPFINKKRLSQIFDAIDASSFYVGDDSPRNNFHFKKKKFHVRMFVCSSRSSQSTQSKMSETRIRSERERSKDAMRRLSVTDEKSMQKKNRSFIRFFLSWKN